MEKYTLRIFENRYSSCSRVNGCWCCQSQELLYDWWFAANEFVLATSPFGITTSIFFRLNTCGYSLWVTSSLKRGRVFRLQLLLVLASAVILSSESRGIHDHILQSQIRNSPQPGGPGSRIYIPEEYGGPVIAPGTGFPCPRLLLLAGLRWRYSIPLPH
jgi:hypothetical protein